MLPCFAADDARYVGLRDIKQVGNLNLCHPFLAHFADMLNVNGRQASTTLAFSVNVHGPSLEGTIPVVVQLCAKEKMIGVAAGSEVTLVQHVQACWDWSMSQSISKAMSFDMGVSETQGTIPTAFSRKPRPTLIWPALVNLRPETLLQRFSRIDTFGHVSPFKRETPSVLAALV